MKYRVDTSYMIIIIMYLNIPNMFYFSICYNRRKCFLRALIGFSVSEYPVRFTDSSAVPPSERRQTCGSYEENGFPVCCRNKQRNFTNNETSCSRISEGDEFGLEVLTGKSLSL